jgi:hypothetical protein
MTARLADIDVSLAVAVDADRVVLYGAAEGPLPASADLRADGRLHADAFAALSWPSAGEGGGHGFLALLSLPGIAARRPREVAVAGPGGLRQMATRLSALRTSPALLISALRDERPDLPVAAEEFARRVLAPAGAPPSDGAARFLAALVREAAHAEGFIEVMGRFRGPGLVLQGWSSALAAGPCELLVDCGEDRVLRADAALFARGDLPAGASGVLAVLPDAEIDPASVRRAYHRGPRGWSRLDVFENRTVLPEGAAAGHVRDMLGRLEGPPDALRALARATAARYEGRDTVSALPVPVRAAIDLAVRAPGCATAVTGWLLDPLGLVAAAEIRGPGFAVRIDGAWARSPRRDVSEGFRADPLFAPHLRAGADRHGFLASAPEPSGAPEAGGLHLELRLADETRAFLPLSPVPAAPEALTRLMAAADPHDPAAEDAVARHVAPLCAAAGAADPAAGAAVHALGRPVPAPRVSVAIPVTDGREDIDLSLARLAVDPDFREAEVLVVAGAAAHERLGRSVRDAAAFHRLDVRLVAAPAVRDACAAAALAARHARAATILLLSPSVLPTETGWLSALERAARRAGRPVAASPTLLYEDASVRFAGIVEDADAPGGVVARFAGYPADWIRGEAPQPVLACTADCVLAPRDALLRAAGAGGFLGPTARDALFARALAAAGCPSVWVPPVRLHAVDDGPRGGDEPWRRVAAAVDRAALAALRASAPSVALPDA